MAAYRIDIILCVLLAQITNCQRQWETLIRHWRPRDAMVDVTNGFGIAIIQDYAHTRGNFAFSPYGAASVLVVLYEGSRGKTASQIQQALQLPWDCVITRIGVRDIHRHLRSYFLHEGYLSGVSMSKENVHLRPEFQNVLRFYGYSLQSEMTTEAQTTSSEVILSTSSPAAVTTTTEQQVIDTKGTTDLSDLTTPVNVSPSVPTSTNLQTVTSTKFYESTDFSSDNMENSVTTITPEEFQTTLTQLSTVMTETPTAVENKEETDVITTLSSVTTQSFVTQSSVMSVEVTTSNEIGSTHSPQGTELTMTSPKPESITETISTSEEIQSTYSSAPTMTLANTESANYTSKGTLNSEGDTANTEVSTVDAALGVTEMLFEIPSTTIITYKTDEVTEAKVNNDNSSDAIEISSTLFTILETNDDLDFTGETATETTTEAENTSRQRREVEGYRLALQSTVMKIGDTARRETCQVNPCYPFLIDGLQEEYVPVISLTATFRFAYLRKLHATALEFPLDNDKYKLLLILPVDRCGLKSLIYSLSLYPLRLVYEALVLTKVNTVLPTFMADGDISLSIPLKKLGIWDIFDPKRANLTGMSDDPELYVRNIEQTIKVNIRNYMDQQNGEITAYGPIERFYATHPFLYFVLDKETHVTLILGKMTNPLSNKIN